ncbi:predicted protein [Nematostella vectensis]|uniref:WW domain-containing oxidoreductase n=1 Tax=Nematostella vectensis TaxID=45351 RepID=A7SUS7_NEMVE|nr:predicted protein [Nematostella vectensis]|eukprot:XP_001624633.1 predicted protein [Nematostella vectensis]
MSVDGQHKVDIQNDESLAEEGLSSQDSDEELPVEWEVRTTDTGRVYYANHLTKTTQWQHPKTGKIRKVTGALPPGWLKQSDGKGDVFYINTVNHQTTFTDPRSSKESTSCINISQKYDASSTTYDVLKDENLDGRVVMVTGASSGIGLATASALAAHGAHVVMACRDMEKAHKAELHIKKTNKDCKLEVMFVDLASFASIHDFVDKFKKKSMPLHVLVCNAGVLGGPWRCTGDNIEYTFAVNYLGHFLLIKLLQDVLCSSSPARIVMLSSESHRFQDLNYSDKLHISTVPLSRDKYHSILAYNQSKLCSIMLSMELNRRLSSEGVTCNAVHPGNLIYTSLYGKSWCYWLIFRIARLFAKTPEQAASTVVYCAVSPELNGVGGQYFINCRPCEPSVEAADPDKARALWTLSERLVTSLKRPQGSNIIDL